MKKFLNMLKKNDNSYSIGRVIAIWSCLLWSVITIYLTISNKTWSHYDTLTLEMIGSVFVVLCDKSFQSSYFTVKHEKGGAE